MTKNSPDTLSFSPTFPTKIVGSAVLLSVLMITWMGWVIFDASRFAELTKTKFLPLELLHGKILQYDEVLTMSARMAAATGDKSWIDRYHGYEPLLDAAIGEVINLSQSSEMVAAVKETDVANVQLVIMEQQSFVLLEEGKLAEARALLSSTAYNQQKAIYAKGMGNLLNLLNHMIDQRVSAQGYRNAVSVGVVIFLLCLTFATWIAVYKSVSKWRTELARSIAKRTEAETALARSHNELEQKIRERTADLKGEINERKIIEEALVESKARFKDFAGSASDWFWEMDRDLRFSYFSARNREITGFNPSSYIGKTRREITPEHTVNEKWRQHLDDLDNHRQFRDFQYDLTRVDGTRLAVSINGKPVFDQNGSFQGFRGTGTDITAQRIVSEERNQALLDAEEANQSKSEFLATMSHEFRTPLNAILGFSDMMRSQFFGPLGSEKYEDYAHDIHISGEHMLALVNDVLDIAAIEAGKRLYTMEVCSIGELMRGCIRNIEQAARQGDLALSSDIPHDLPTFYADIRSVRQIFLNLLSNAIKFTNPKGKIVISATATDQELIIRVRDTGIGISADKLPDITTPFSQLHSDPHRTQEGTGLGLSIVASLVDANDGELKIESEVGKGTTVTVSFPIQVTEAKRASS